MSFADQPTGSASVIGADLERDLALLRVELIDAVGARALAFGDSDSLANGEEVIAVGYPKGVGITLTRGIVSGLKRSIVTNLVQTDAALNPGNSGGPLLNKDGLLVGIADFNFPGFPGLNFAVASSTAMSFLRFAAYEPLPEARVQADSSGLPPYSAASYRESQRYFNDLTGEDVIEGVVENSARTFAAVNVVLSYRVVQSGSVVRTYPVRLDVVPPGERRVSRLRVPRGTAETLRLADFRWTIEWARR